ncbi:HtaA domain-containing protein [Stackebrandtia soli]|uniref:HtaA domain-containing protein n=1 Tax=Stackebrandtia soli TaxID=1892856 RepID=UPI0039E89B99
MSTHTPIRRWLGRISAVAAAALLGLGAMPGLASADDAAVSDGTLNWGVKESFRNYVTGPIGGGDITVLDGAVENADGTFGFGSGTGTLSGDDVSVSFTGAVRFEAHHGALDLTIANLAVDTASGELTADVTSKDMSSGEFVEYPGVTLADLDDAGAERSTDGDVTTIAGIAATLTANGSGAFGGFYGEGTALDTATVIVTTGDDGTPTPADGEVSDGSLDWGVKESFRNYIVGPIADGDIEVSDGATETDAGFRFMNASGDFAADAVDVVFDGAVRFYGHSHGDGTYELDLTLSDLRLVGDGADALLYSGDVAIANVDLGDGFTTSDGVASLVDAPVTLTAEGGDYFGGFYGEGTELDPLTVHLALTDDATIPGGNPGVPAGPGGPTLAKTGASLTAILAGGAGLLVVGGGALWLTRRRALGAAA